VALSREQRRTIDGLLTRLETVLQRARRHRMSQGVWRAAKSSRG
jgi:hypothetical protein